MPPLVSDRPIWLTPPTVFVQTYATTPEHLNDGFAKIIASANPLNSLLTELQGFLTGDNYNGLTLQLDPTAHDRARGYLTTAANSTVYPRPELTPDSDGGIEIEWENNGRRLVLSCKAHQDDVDFISWREPQGQYDGRPASQGILNDRLAWLMA